MQVFLGMIIKYECQLSNASVSTYDSTDIHNVLYFFMTFDAYGKN